jgi:hypothetical protein
MPEAVGLSVGATNLAAVAGRATVTRQSVLTLYRHRPPEVGVPSENPNIDERGLVITGFVDRVGDPVGIVAADGSAHRGEVLVADALRALLHTVTDRQPPAQPATVSHPAHWRPQVVEALRQAVAALPEWSRSSKPVALLSDATAALTALQADAGVPARGVIALCDFGGTGTGITLADAANGYEPIAPIVRHTDFSGDLIDQALLKHVIADLSSAGSVDVSGTSAIGSLNRLRAECRGAKERLSGATVTSVVVDLPGFRSEIRLTRDELEEEIRRPLAEFIGVLQETMDASGIRPADLVAVASVGGGANIPVITTTLSENLRIPVITTARPELAAASGAALRAARGPADESATALAAAVPPTAPAPALLDAGPKSSTFRALAWSEAADEPEDFGGEHVAVGPPVGATSARPLVEFEREQGEAHEEAEAALPWYRRPLPVVGALLAVILMAAASVFVVLRHSSGPSPTTTTTPVTTPPASTAVAPPATEAPPPEQTHAPGTRTVTQVPPPVTRTVTPPPPTSQAPPPTSQPPPTSEAPPPTSEAPTTTQPPFTLPPFVPKIPGVPTVFPAPQPQPGQ